NALELVADLLEVVAMARGVEVAAHLPERELEVVERVGRALHHDAAVEDAAAMLERALERDVVGLHDFHWGFLLGGAIWWRTPRQIVSARIACFAPIWQSHRRVSRAQCSARSSRAVRCRPGTQGLWTPSAWPLGPGSALARRSRARLAGTRRPV